MNKIITTTLILFVLFQISPINAQDTLMNFNNRWSTELNINPFNGNLSFNNAAGQIKLRKFQPNGTAWRFGLTLSYNQNNSDSKNVYGTNPYNNTFTQRSTLIGLNIGKEKHFRSSRRLSPYVGWDIGIANKSSFQKTKSGTSTTEVKGAWLNYTQNSSSQNSSQYYLYQSVEERGFISLQTNFIMGFDFYMSEKFFFGYELLFGLEYISLKDVDITLTNASQPSSDPVPDTKAESWKFGPKLVNGIRIGFVF